MALQDTVAHAARGFADRLRRDAIAYGACAICALAALILATCAAVTALIPMVGIIYAQLIVAGAFLVITGGIVLWMQRSGRQPAQPLALGAAAETAQRQAQFAQIAMIIEAVMLGYSLSRRR
ncbi:hypothetical protein [Pseudorhodoplanes sp.]|jgi:hypothetical protein|uniref:hypothetical protein n=1 Tax=Pseudorhodoplanes sp. TaxID=1934341 RepID=UPI002CC2DBB1|nr:hypothetical protein [Pseudorhodoplanes sp.]HWV42152.1 hypothetical protein [Pseudorhodoplanes sp.]